MAANDVATDPSNITLSFRVVQACSIFGIVGSLTVVVGNTILYAHGEPQAWSQWSLNLAYWAGSIALPVASLGYVQLLVGLRPAGTWWATPPVVFLMYFFALGSAGHGSVFPVYEFWQGFAQPNKAQPFIGPIAELKSDLQRHMSVLMLVAVGSMAMGSFWFSASVWFKRTLYPRWMALFNVFMISALTIGVSQIEAIPSPIRTVAAGFGFHLGALALMISSLLILRRRLPPAGTTA